VTEVTQNTLEIIDRLPPRASGIIKNAIELGKKDLHLQIVDSSLVLFAIIKLEDENASAKWLRKVKLTDTAILRFVNQDYSVRNVVARSFSPAIVFTQSLVKMVNHLDRLGRDSRVANEVYIANVLEAITYSDSPTVQRIFASVNLNMIEVRSVSNPPSIIDREKLYARRT
jgi:hypothetical protein